MRIRDAHDPDVAAITAIYNDAVEHSTAIWNDVTVTAENRAAWLADRRAAGYPVRVAVDESEQVLGYATFGDWRPHDGYRYTVEHSVYVRGDQRGKGLGKELMIDLIACARTLGKHVMIAGVDATNVASIRLHESLGFTFGGTLHQVGTKFGRWLDLTFMELRLHADPE